jgi:hypothetical protein
MVALWCATKQHHRSKSSVMYVIPFHEVSQTTVLVFPITTQRMCLRIGNSTKKKKKLRQKKNNQRFF